MGNSQKKSSKKALLNLPSEALPQVVLLGRPNVGKSTLFNRLVGRRQAIVDDQPGVTRDLQYGRTSHRGIDFAVVDTGGLIPAASTGSLNAGVRRKVGEALVKAKLACFLVDGRLGLTPAESELARWLREWGGEVLVVVHKIDEPKHEPLISEFYRLGFDNVLGLSAESLLGLPKFLDTVVKGLPTTEEILAELPDPQEETEDKPRALRLAIVGQPNAGKSTLLNALAGEERALVSEVAGTTLDPVTALVEREGFNLEVVDTAGIKRRRSTKGKVEKVGVLKALSAVKQADLVLLLVDATVGFVLQDLKILAEAESAGRALLIILNKWDLVPSGTTLKDLTEPFRDRFKRHTYVPAVGVSAKTGRGLKPLLKKIQGLADNYRRRIGTGELNRFLQEALRTHQPPVVQSKALNLNYLTQTHAAPPRFVIFTNHPKLIPESYLRFLERRLRKGFDFSGVPIKWFLRKKKQNSLP